MPYPCKRTNERILISILLAKDVKPALFSRQVDELTDALVVGVKRHSRGCLLIQMRDSSKVLGPLAQDACDVVFSQFISLAIKSVDFLTGRSTFTSVIFRR